MAKSDTSLSLVRLLEPAVLANPYPLYHKLRSEDPVHWDWFLHTWVVTRYPDVVNVLHSFSADRTPTPEQLAAMGLSALNPIAKVMVKQMLSMDAPAHTRLRGLASAAFTPGKVEALRGHIQEIANGVLDRVQTRGRMDIISDFAAPLPAIVTAEMLGVPTEDHTDLKKWSADFAEMLGNFQHNPDRIPRVLESTNNLTTYFQAAISKTRQHPREGLIHSFVTAEVDGDRLTDEEIVANSDPERFPNPDQLILDRSDNKHLAFGWSSHFCFGAPLARMEGQIAFETILRRLPNLKAAPGPLTWRNNSGLRGLTALPVTFSTN